MNALTGAANHERKQEESRSGGSNSGRGTHDRLGGVLRRVSWRTVERRPGPIRGHGRRCQSVAVRDITAYLARSLTAQSVELSASEFEQFKVEPAVERDFTIQRGAVGNIAFQRRDVGTGLSPVQGKIITLFARAGDDVKRGMHSTRLTAPTWFRLGRASSPPQEVLRLTTRVLQRARQLYECRGSPRRTWIRPSPSSQAAEGAFKATRDAVRIFGKTDADMDRIIAERKIDPVLVVRKPSHGTGDSAKCCPRLLAQPGTQPAPYTLSDVSIMWMLANVAETDFRSSAWERRSMSR